MLVAFDDGDDVAADGAGHLHEHQSDGAAADDGDGIADFDAGFMKPAQNAGQRLSHGGVFETDVWRNDQHVGFDDAARNANVFGVGSVVEEQVFAKIFLVLGAVEAHLARRGIQRDYLHALLEAMNAFADFFDDSGQLVAKERRGNDHAGVIAALIHFEIGTAGESHLDFDEDLSLFDAGDGYSFNFKIFFAVQDGGCHFSVHSLASFLGLTFPVTPRLNHDLHRRWLRMGGEFQGSRALLQREAMTNQSLQIHLAVHHKTN